MNTQATNKPYPREFREQVVKLALAGGQTVPEIALEFEISRDSVRRWLKQAELDTGSRQAGLSTPERKELVKLRRDNRRLRMEREILAKAAAWFARETDSIRIFEFVRAYQARYPIACQCRVLGVSTSGYYAWQRRPPSRRTQANRALSQEIAKIHKQSRGIYGARRVQAQLRADGTAVSRRRVARLMRASGLQGVTRRRVATTRRDPPRPAGDGG